MSVSVLFTINYLFFCFYFLYIWFLFSFNHSHSSKPYCCWFWFDSDSCQPLIHRKLWWLNKSVFYFSLNNKFYRNIWYSDLKYSIIVFDKIVYNLAFARLTPNPLTPIFNSFLHLPYSHNSSSTFSNYPPPIHFSVHFTRFLFNLPCWSKTGGILHCEVVANRLPPAKSKCSIFD